MQHDGRAAAASARPTCGPAARAPSQRLRTAALWSTDVPRDGAGHERRAAGDGRPAGGGRAVSAAGRGPGPRRVSGGEAPPAPAARHAVASVGGRARGVAVVAAASRSAPGSARARRHPLRPVGVRESVRGRRVAARPVRRRCRDRTRCRPGPRTGFSDPTARRHAVRRGRRRATSPRSCSARWSTPEAKDHSQQDPVGHARVRSSWRPLVIDAADAGTAPTDRGPPGDRRAGRARRTSSCPAPGAGTWT